MSFFNSTSDEPSNEVAFPATELLDPVDPALANLADLALSPPPEPLSQAPSGTYSWFSRLPTLLPPSPIPGGSHPPPPTHSPQLFPRLGHSACSSASGDIYIFGGFTESNRGRPIGGSYSNDLFLYSVKENTATFLQCYGDLPSHRYRHVSAVIGKVLLVWGGTAGGGHPDGLYLLNLVTREWTKISVEGQVPVSREVPAATAVGSTFYVFGGYTGRRHNDLWAFDFNTLRTESPAWERIEPSSSAKPSPRDSTMCVPYEGRLILFGGSDGNTRNDVWSFDPKTRSWSELSCTGSIPAPRYHHAMTIVKDTIFIFCGIYDNDSSAAHPDEFAAFKISTQHWYILSSIGSTPNPRTSHMMTSVGNKVFVIGGSLKDRDSGGADHIFYALDIKDVEATDFHTGARIQLQELKDELQKLEHQKLKEGEIWERKVKRLEEELDTIHQITLTPKLLAHSGKKGFLRDGDEAQVVVDFLTRALENEAVVQSNAERKAVFRLLTKTAKSSQVFPKRFEISGVHCDVTVTPVYEGGYGRIYRGEYMGQVVCVKAVKVYGGGAKKSALRAHAGELVLAAHATHRNIVPFYGAYTSREASPRICIVSPWMENGNLTTFLEQNPSASRIHLMHDTASALQHIHAMDIVHSDIKASNVLVSKSQRAMLADFGVSTIATTSVGTTTSKDIAGTLNWMAPELLAVNPDSMDGADDQGDGMRPPTKESDMWSFGCLCFEAWTGKIPFEQFRKSNHFILAFTRGGATPIQPNPKAGHLGIPGWSPGLVAKVAELCWSYDTKQRPTAEDVQSTLANGMAEDGRPSTDDENALFETAKQGRSSETKVDYDRVSAIVKRIEMTSN